MLASYTVTMILLHHTLKKIDWICEDKSTKRKVLVQYGVFMFAFLIKMCIELYPILTDEKNRADMNFTYEIFECASKFFLDWLPVCYMLYCHCKVYRAREKNILQANLIIAEEQSDSEDG